MNEIWVWAALVAGLGYLLGSVPFGMILTRAAGLDDVRAIGSGNIGATNVLRTGRKDLALLTLLLDGGKGAAAVLLARELIPYAGTAPMTGREPALIAGALSPEFALPLAALAGGAAFAGHLFPIWLRFRGGKGVATFFGVLLAVAWPLALIAAAAWLAVAGLSRFSSAAALAAAVLTPNAAALTGQPTAVILLAAFMGALILVKHRANMARLRAGTEPRIGGSKESPAA